MFILNQLFSTVLVHPDWDQHMQMVMKYGFELAAFAAPSLYYSIRYQYWLKRHCKE